MLLTIISLSSSIKRYMVENVENHPDELSFIKGIRKHIKQYFYFPEGSEVLEECPESASFIRIQIVDKCLTVWRKDPIKEKVRLAKVHLKDNRIHQFEDRHNDEYLRTVSDFFLAIRSKKVN